MRPYHLVQRSALLVACLALDACALFPAPPAAPQDLPRARAWNEHIPLKYKDFFAPDAAANLGADRDKMTLIDAEKIRAEALGRVNALRASGSLCGTHYFPPVAPLKWNEKLYLAAAAHSIDIAQSNVVSHQSLDGSTPGERIRAVGYQFSVIGENITAGQSSIADAIHAWKESPFHCEQMMQAEIEEMGLAWVQKRDSFYRHYWTLDLGKAVP
ncbi:MAG: CAP domain-containing protein [Burkholderiaceae bacterium]|nr:CAP domain-containing protein [Burkholderiaceae bacterium]